MIRWSSADGSSTTLHASYAQLTNRPALTDAILRVI